ncbi:hypothetical protein M885DRAFT_446487, partial [Pelagophyceae sp. CCMP2097]
EGPSKWGPLEGPSDRGAVSSGPFKRPARRAFSRDLLEEPSQGVVSSGPSRGANLEGPSSWRRLEGPSQGTVSSGPSQGTVSSGPSRRPSREGPSKGPSRGPSRGPSGQGPSDSCPRGTMAVANRLRAKSPCEVR